MNSKTKTSAHLHKPSFDRTDRHWWALLGLDVEPKREQVICKCSFAGILELGGPRSGKRGLRDLSFSIYMAKNSYGIWCMLREIQSNYQWVLKLEHTLMDPSSLPVNIHLPSFWNPTSVTLVVWPSYATTGLGLWDAISNSFTWGFPAAAKNCLSSVILSRFTWLSLNHRLCVHFPVGGFQKLIFRI